jgi:hypothetical protein
MMQIQSAPNRDKERSHANGLHHMTLRKCTVLFLGLAFVLCLISSIWSLGHELQKSWVLSGDSRLVLGLATGQIHLSYVEVESALSDREREMYDLMFKTRPLPQWPGPRLEPPPDTFLPGSTFSTNGPFGSFSFQIPVDDLDDFINSQVRAARNSNRSKLLRFEMGNPSTMRHGLENALIDKIVLAFPIWPLNIVLMILIFAVLRKPIRRRARIKNACCPDCGYNLQGNTSGTCPECGMAICLNKVPVTSAGRADI